MGPMTTAKVPGATCGLFLMSVVAMKLQVTMAPPKANPVRPTLTAKVPGATCGLSLMFAAAMKKRLSSLNERIFIYELTQADTLSPFHFIVNQFVYFTFTYLILIQAK